ncbi:hypothetical protein BFW88_13175 [Pseudomonas fluorescens]|nr:hypothetical protein BFW88_13175 [Pseudomonas fluorescens]OPB10499.1 hypothetical protein BFW92_13370 [Pseudomonas fluorescens]OPB21752.1 hypothetical protein BFW93_13160 [Pseudomonas fluorescens]
MPVITLEVQKKAQALVHKADAELAGTFTTALMDQVGSDSARSRAPSSCDIPPNSTFGQLWAQLTQALNSEPFATFAKKNNINVSNLKITPSGWLDCTINGRLTNVGASKYTPGFEQATQEVLTIARKLSPGNRAFVYVGAHKAMIDAVGNFYGVQVLNTPTGTFTDIRQLQNFMTFPSVLSPDTKTPGQSRPEYQHARQLQDEAAQDLALQIALEPGKFSPAQSNQSVAQRVEDADLALAKLCSRFLYLANAPGHSASDGFYIAADELPEYSTLKQTRRAFQEAFATDGFLNFAKQNNIEISSIRVDPLSGELTCQVTDKNGSMSDKRFSQTDNSGWSTVATDIWALAKSLAAGSSSRVSYPGNDIISCRSMLNFYGERSAPSPLSTEQLLRQCVALNRNGFAALKNDNPTPDEASLAVKAKRQAVIERLSSPAPAQPDATPSQAPDAQDMVDAESALAVAVHRVMLGLKAEASDASTKMIESIPANSLFGQWWTYLGKALKARCFTEWARQQNIDLASLRFDPTDNALIGNANGVEQRFTAIDFAKKYPEHFDVLTPVLTAAAAFTAHGKPISLVHADDSSAPFEQVANFYDISTDYGSSAFEQDTELMGRTQAFRKPSEDPQRIVNWLSRQKNALGDSNDRYALINQLKKANIYNDSTTRFIVDPDSSHQPKGETTVQQYLTDQGWYGATGSAEVDNLLRALQTPTPQAPPLGNGWGFLSTALPLTTDQRGTVAAFVRKSIDGHDNLLSYLSSGVSSLSTDPAQALQQLLSSNKALELAVNLETEMKGATNSTSLKNWLLTALVIEFDPNAGTQRNTVAGFDFARRENWGLGTDGIREQFSRHLAGTQKLSADLLPIASQLLMSGMAPQYLVKNVPQTVTQGSPEWVAFVTAVNRIEQIAPGAASGSDYTQVMRLHDIKPISRPETLHLLKAQMNPVIDWSIANKVIDKNDKDEYTSEQLQRGITQLVKQSTDVANAKRYLSETPVPERRTLALENLTKKFGDQIPYEDQSLWKEDGTLYGTLASVVEAYEAEQLGDTYKSDNLIDRLFTKANTSAWEAKDPRIPIQLLHDRVAELPDVNTQYDAAIEKDYPARREHSIAIIKDLLSRLPPDDRNSLAHGRLEYYSVRESDTSAWQNLHAKKGKKGSHGLIIRSTDSQGKVSDFGLFPDAGTVKKLSGLPVPMPAGGTNAAFGKIYDGRDEGPHTLPLDFAAFSSAQAPRDGVTCDVIVDNVPPMRLINGELVNEGIATFGQPDTRTAPGYSSEAFDLIANIAVDSHFLRKDEYKAINRGYNQLEKKGPTFLERLNTLARMIPGVTSIEDAFQGNYAAAGRDLLIDALGLIIPGVVGKGWSLAAEGLERVAAEAAGEAAGEAFVQSAEGGGEAVIRNMTTSSTSKSLNALSRLQDSHLAPSPLDASSPAANMADGTVMHSGLHEHLKTTAVRQNGEWYAYDTKTMATYGPPLNGFVSDTSTAVRQETFSDGTQALVTDKPLAAEAYTIARSHGFDLINEGKVYRYDTRNPGVLTDLASADHFKPLDDFEAVCPVPPVSGRIKRGANDTCFSKVIEDVSGELAQELQALEHVRLFPSTPKFLRKDQFVILERRRYKMVDGEMGPRLIPTLDSKPITYKTLINGRIKHDPEFGFSAGRPSDALSQETRVIKLDRISDACDDKREVRGVIVNGPSGRGVEKYLVIEADTAEFYYARLNDTTDQLTFIKCTPNELPLVQSYRNKFSIRQGAARLPFDANFVALPKLDTAFKQLARSGYSNEDVEKLKTLCQDLTEEQQREIVYQLQRLKAIDKPAIALLPNQMTQLPQPADFTSWTAEQQNKFYAQQAKDSVNRSMKVTGLGPSNKIRSKTDMARADAADIAIGWLRNINGAEDPNYSNLILKTGAGNCGEMARLSKDIIKKSGGRAYEWYASDAHAFTVVGGPSTLPSETKDFSGAAWTDAWIVDPWADIACPAREYTQKLKEVMAKWHLEKLEVAEGRKRFSPLEKNWMEKLINQPKAPYSNGYAGV